MFKSIWGKYDYSRIRAVKGIAETNELWVLIDLSREPNSFYITPLSWIRNDIYEAYMDYLQKHGGHRPQNDESTHHAISVKRITDWKDAWGMMGLSL
ncbi:hypothetical protein [Rahnella inusitata]|uniref:hypothetical protein n=1 Tax=Rahnella inusitata TaxID=58169 RepID=UPI0039BEC40E